MPQDESPVNPLPIVVLVGFVAMVGIEAALSLGGAGLIGGPMAVGWRASLIEALGFAPAVQEMVLSGHGDASLVLRYVGYPLVHGSFTHAAFALALWLALGKFVADLYRPWAVVAIVLAGVIGAAVVHGTVGLLLNRNAPLFGAYPADYALIGAYTYVLWVRLGQQGKNRLQAFGLIGMLLGLQFGLGLAFGAALSGTADLGGFVCGGLVAIAVAPGGWGAFLRRMRRR